MRAEDIYWLKNSESGRGDQESDLGGRQEYGSNDGSFKDVQERKAQEANT